MTVCDQSASGRGHRVDAPGRVGPGALREHLERLRLARRQTETGDPGVGPRAVALTDARRRTVELVSPTAEKVFENVYSDPHPLVDAQRAWFAEYDASFEGAEA